METLVLVLGYSAMMTSPSTSYSMVTSSIIYKCIIIIYLLLTSSFVGLSEMLALDDLFFTSAGTYSVVAGGLIRTLF